jgi:hypothetical protein
MKGIAAWIIRAIKTEPNACLALAAAVYALVQGIAAAKVDQQVVVALIAAVGALVSRQAVTPLTRPRNNAGVPLVPSAVSTTDGPGTDALGS